MDLSLQFSYVNRKNGKVSVLTIEEAREDQETWDSINIGAFATSEAEIEEIKAALVKLGKPANNVQKTARGNWLVQHSANVGPRYSVADIEAYPIGGKKPPAA